jgi:hypothetical protein
VGAVLCFDLMSCFKLDTYLIAFEVMTLSKGYFLKTKEPDVTTLSGVTLSRRCNSGVSATISLEGNVMMDAGSRRKHAW